MAKISGLDRETKAWVDGLIDDETEGKAEVRASDVAAALVAHLFRLAEFGDERATAAIVGLSRDGARTRVNERLKDDRGLIRLASNGAVVSLPSRYGVPAVARDGRRERYHQQTLWWELTWDRFEALIATLEHQRSLLGRGVEALNDVLMLRERYPESATPGEACAQAGIDPRSFALEGAA